jgi:hypothetical protein
MSRRCPQYAQHGNTHNRERQRNGSPDRRWSASRVFATLHAAPSVEQHNADPDRLWSGI